MTMLLVASTWFAFSLLATRCIGINYLEADDMPEQPTTPHNRRTNHLMREHVALVALCRDRDLITTRNAGERLSRAGVPFEVACRVLRGRAA